MAGQQQPFPLTSDEQMAEATADPGLAGRVGSSGMSSRERAAMADLEQALGLAAAWFGGDEAAARWAAGGSGGSAPGSPVGVLPGSDIFDAPGEAPQWADDATWQAADAEQDALLGHPATQLAQHDDPLGLGGGPQDRLPSLDEGHSSVLSGLDTGNSGVLAGAPWDAAADDAAEAGGASTSAGLGGAVPGQKERGDSAGEASSVARELGAMQLDDIDAEPADAAAPGVRA